GGHVVDRDDDPQVERLAGPGVDDGDLPVRADTAKEPGDRLERALGSAQADALGCSAFVAVAVAVARLLEAIEALEAQGEVGATLRARDRMDLVDDDVLDAAEDVPGLARQEQVQALGRGDEDVWRSPRQ